VIHGTSSPGYYLTWNQFSEFFASTASGLVKKASKRAAGHIKASGLCIK